MNALCSSKISPTRRAEVSADASRWRRKLPRFRLDRRSSHVWQRPPKSLHQAPDSTTRLLSSFTGFSKPDLKSHPPAARRSCGKRPNLARLSESAVSFHIGLSRTWEDLRWQLGFWKKHRPNWSLHVEDGAFYCGQHGLYIKTFGRCMKHLMPAAG